MTGVVKFKQSYNRPNLSYEVWKKERATERIADFIKSHKRDSGIVYCLSRKDCEVMAEKLNEVRPLACHPRCHPCVAWSVVARVPDCRSLGRAW